MTDSRHRFLYRRRPRIPIRVRPGFPERHHSVMEKTKMHKFPPTCYLYNLRWYIRCTVSARVVYLYIAAFLSTALISRVVEPSQSPNGDTNNNNNDKKINRVTILQSRPVKWIIIICLVRGRGEGAKTLIGDTQVIPGTAVVVVVVGRDLMIFRRTAKRLRRVQLSCRCRALNTQIPSM